MGLLEMAYLDGVTELEEGRVSCGKVVVLPEVRSVGEDTVAVRMASPIEMEVLTRQSHRNAQQLPSQTIP